MKNIKDCRILYMGTPEISAKVLKGLILEGFNIVGVVAQKDKPVGRKHIILPVPTKKVAIEYNIPVFQPEKIRKDYEFVKEINPDLILTLAYGQIVPSGLLAIPKYGCLNLHGSLLPKYRGAAPIQYALINNDKITGMSLMEMIDKMDAGDVFATKSIVISTDDNATTLFDKMADVAFELAKEALPLYLNGNLQRMKQDENLVTYCPTIKPEEEKLSFEYSKDKIFGYIRALSETPGAYFLLDGEKFKILKASIVSNEIVGQIGEIVKADKQGLYIQCKDGILALLQVQKSGKNKMDYKSFVNGNQNLKGKILY